jgi:TonB family protein
MLEQKPRPEPGTSGIRAAYKQSRKLFLAIVLLLVALTVVLVKNHQFWFGAEETPVADETSVESAPNTATHAPSALAAQDKKHVAAKGSTNPVVAEPTVIATGRAVLPPMDIEVVAGDKHRTVHPGSNSVTIEMPPDSGSEPAGSTTVKSTAQPGPATNAAELVRMSPDRAQAPQGAVDSFYPPLVPKMKVQGSVVLQAHIGADGIIQEMRVLSGPAILVSAAREAARQWQFKPYLQNG